MSALIRKLPKTYYKTKKLVALKDDFKKYIYCKRCASIYKFQELISGVDKYFATMLPFLTIPTLENVDHVVIHCLSPIGHLLVKLSLIPRIYFVIKRLNRL